MSMTDKVKNVVEYCEELNTIERGFYASVARFLDSPIYNHPHPERHFYSILESMSHRHPDFIRPEHLERAYNCDSVECILIVMGDIISEAKKRMLELYGRTGVLKEVSTPGEHVGIAIGISQGLVDLLVHELGELNSVVNELLELQYLERYRVSIVEEGRYSYRLVGHFFDGTTAVIEVNFVGLGTEHSKIEAYYMDCSVHGKGEICPHVGALMIEADLMRSSLEFIRTASSMISAVSKSSSEGEVST